MRLICPNCGAQYAVDARAVPATGRDVQCSACGFTWFQVHPSEDEDLAEELGHAQPAPAPEAEPGDIDAGPQEPAGQPPEPPPRRPVDPDVMSVLREEARREQAARRAEQAALEVQGDLDLVPPPAADRTRAAAPARVPLAEPAAGPVAGTPVRRAMPADLSRDARLPPGGLEALGDEERAARPAPRRDRLPDIEEITSTLEPGNRFEAGAPPPQDIHQVRAARIRRSQGKRIGFGLACAIFTLLTVFYLQGERIGAALPAFEPGLQTYMARVEDLRHWIDDALRSVAGSAVSTRDTPPG